MALNGQGSHQPDPDQIPGQATSQQIQKTAPLGSVGALPTVNHDMIEPTFTRPAHIMMPYFASFPAVQGSPIGPRPRNSEAPRAQHTFPVPVPSSSFMSFPATPGSNFATDATTTILPIYTPLVSLIAKPTKANHLPSYSPNILPNTIFTTSRTIPPDHFMGSSRVPQCRLPINQHEAQALIRTRTITQPSTRLQMKLLRKLHQSSDRQ